MHLLNRISNVHAAYVNSVGISSVFQIGDSCQITPIVKAIAIQREQEIFFGNEGNFNKFSLFREKIPQPIFDEDFYSAYYDETPTINVKGIKVTAVSSSAVIHLGSTDEIKSIARIKHIRQLEKEE